MVFSIECLLIVKVSKRYVSGTAWYRIIVCFFSSPPFMHLQPIIWALQHRKYLKMHLKGIRQNEAIELFYFKQWRLSLDHFLRQKIIKNKEVFMIFSLVNNVFTEPFLVRARSVAFISWNSSFMDVSQLFFFSFVLTIITILRWNDTVDCAPVYCLKMKDLFFTWQRTFKYCRVLWFSIIVIWKCKVSFWIL